MEWLLDWWYNEPEPQLNVQFGKYSDHLEEYNDICARILTFAREVGPDPYNRIFNAELLVDFALSKEITDKSVDYIVRHYVYEKLSQIQTVDLDKLELQDLYNEFQLLDS